MLTVIQISQEKLSMPPINKILIAGYPAGIPGPTRVSVSVKGTAKSEDDSASVTSQTIILNFDQERRVS
jgi:hypothetical protein